MLVNGQTSDSIPANDRGLAYGDGLFETMRIAAGRLPFAQAHLERLARGAAVLGIPCDLANIRQWLDTALAQAPAEGVLKLVLTRGPGGRGYRPPEIAQPTCVISWHPLPALPAALLEQGAEAFVCGQRLAHQGVLAGIKHLNRLEQVLASQEFATHHEAFEGLMADQENRVVEGTRSNLFLVLDGRWLTPALTRCGVRGILREDLLSHFRGRLEEADIPLARLHEAAELFVANSVIGVVPVTRLQLDGNVLERAIGSFTQAAMARFRETLTT